MKRRKRNARQVTGAVPSSSSAPSATPSHGLPDWLIWVILAAAALALHAGSLQHPLVFDDEHLTESFLRNYGRAFFALDFRWFAYASFGWTYNMFGTDQTWLRVGNVLLHGATAAALYALLSRLLTEAPQREGRCSPRLSAFLCALAFVLHPVAIYATAYLMQRSTLMATLFCLLALLAWQRGVKAHAIHPAHSLAWYLTAVAAYFVAVFSKEHAITLPLVAAAMVWLIRGQNPDASLGKSRGGAYHIAREFAMPALISAVIAGFIVLRGSGVLGAAYEPFAQGAIARLSESAASSAASALAGQSGVFAASLVNQGYLFFHYLLLWILPWPGWMAIDLRPSFPSHWLAWPQWCGLVAWLGWGLAAVWLMCKSRRLALAGFALLCPWLLGLTEFSTVRIQEPFVLYRSYLWMAGFMLLPALLLCQMTVRTAIAAALLVGAVYLASATDRLNSLSSELRVWDDAVTKIVDDKAPLADRPWRNRGVAHFGLEQYAAAARDFEQALRINPMQADNWVARGSLHMRAARTDAALADFNRALAIFPNHVDALGRRCIVQLRLQQLNAAHADCLRARDIYPEDASAHVSLGMVLALKNQPVEAERAYQQALSLAPALPDAHYQFGVLLAGTGRAGAARSHFSIACGARMQAACRRL